jgi:ATP-binding cassette subfamily C protein
MMWRKKSLIGGSSSAPGVRRLHDNPLTAAMAACRPHFLFAALFSGMVNLLYLAPSIYMLQVYDRVVSTRGTATLVTLTAILALALACSALLDAFRMQLLQRASVRLEKLAAEPVLSRALSPRSGDLAARQSATRDFDTLRQTMTGPAILALFDAPWAPIYIGVCFLLHPWIGVLALVASALLAGIAWWTEHATAGLVQAASVQSNQTYSMQDFSIRSAETVSALGMHGTLVQRHLGQRLGTVALQVQATQVSGRLLALTKFLRMFIQSLALGAGALLAIEGMISGGAIFAASLLISRALQPIEQFMGAFRNTLSARAAYRNLRVLCDTSGDAEPMPLPTPLGHLSVEGLTVETDQRDAPVLSDIVFDARPGELIALIGPSGSGKSTLMRVLAGGLPPTEGVVRLDAASYADWNPEQLATHIGYMPQDATLFPGTVRDNIARFHDDGPDNGEAINRAVIEAATAAGVHDMILHLPRGYDTPLGPGGVMLSAGQSQRVAFARALYGKPVLVLLDEPNAHLDGEGDVLLMRKLAELKQAQATLIVSTHRTGILQVADRILVLKDGRVQTFGPRDDVIKPRVANDPAGATDAGNAPGAASHARRRWFGIPSGLSQPDPGGPADDGREQA